MKLIKPSNNAQQWPRNAVKSVECRKRDLVVRIADWSRDKDEPAFDVEVYIGGVYDFNESQSFTKHEHSDLGKCKRLAAEYAAKQIARLL